MESIQTIKIYVYKNVIKSFISYILICITRGAQKLICIYIYIYIYIQLCIGQIILYKLANISISIRHKLYCYV